MRTLQGTVLAAVAACTLIAACSSADRDSRVRLRAAGWEAQISPATLAVTVVPSNGRPVEVSAPQPGLGVVRDLTHSHTRAAWGVGDPPVRVAAEVVGDALHLRFEAEGPANVTWPVVVPGREARAYLLPLFEGSYVPVDNAEWGEFLADSGPMSTTEGLSMPFLGVEHSAQVVTYLLANQFYNTLRFQFGGQPIRARVTHRFAPRNRDGAYEVIVYVDPPSPIQPARRYREWLIDRGEFVSLRDKIARLPEAGKLLGAAHVYLWGGAPLSRHDVIDWRRFARVLRDHARQGGSSPAGRIWKLLPEEARAAVEEIAAQSASAYATRTVSAALSDLLRRADFYDASAWSEIQLPPEAVEMIEQRPDRLPEAALIRLNGLLLSAAFPGEFLDPSQWGDGVSVKMMDRLAAAGLDRLWLGLDSWGGAFSHPEAVARAKALGYLIATYDSYESIHAPDEPETWETAQFDRHLYETGAIIRPDGTPSPGFQGKGHRLNPVVARPYVEERVNRLMSSLPERLNSWFIDCDAYGDLEDDYSPDHPMTQRDDMQARLDRMAWIRDTYNLVIGSERGAAYAAPVLHFAHGMMTPVIGWGDPDLQQDRASPYFLGAWWPPDSPQVMIKQVPLKPRYRTLYYDPRFRLPLYQTVFHDSLITTHHWGYASLKFADETQAAALLELLYNVPPLYHLNLDELEKHRERIVSHYAFFSPLHRELGELPLTDFAFLRPDRLLQRAVFGDRVEMVANFDSAEARYGDTTIPARSILARHLATGEVNVFTP